GWSGRRNAWSEQALDSAGTRAEQGERIEAVATLEIVDAAHSARGRKRVSHPVHPYGSAGEAVGQFLELQDRAGPQLRLEERREGPVIRLRAVGAFARRA